MAQTYCSPVEAVLTHKNGDTFDTTLSVEQLQTQTVDDGFCKLRTGKAKITGCNKDPIESLESVTSIQIGVETWDVYQPPSFGCNHCKWMWVLRIRQIVIPCEEPSTICECQKDESCEGGFFAIPKFATSGRIRKMGLSESVQNGVRQNVWDYRYYSKDLERICELTSMRRLLIKQIEGGVDYQYRVTSANFSGVCPFAVVVREKNTTEIIEDVKAERALIDG